MRKLATVTGLCVACLVSAPAFAQFDETCFGEKIQWFYDQVFGFQGTIANAIVTGSDLDGGGIPDEFEVALATYSVCTDPAIDAVFVANHNELVTYTGQGPWWGTPVAFGFLSLISADWITYLESVDAGLTGVTLNALTTGKAANEPLSPSGDFDGDGVTNLAEYMNVVNTGGGTGEYAQAASDPSSNGTDPNFVPSVPAGAPVAGALGLGLLAASLAFGGTMAMKRRK